MATSWFGVKFFFKRKKICFSQVEMLKIKNNLSRREVLSLAVVDPTDPTAKWEPEKIGFWCQIPFLLPEKGFLHRTDCKLKIRSTVTYIARFLLLNLDHIDRELLCDNRYVGTGICFTMSFLWMLTSSSHGSKLNKRMCQVIRLVQEMRRTLCPQNGHKVQ